MIAPLKHILWFVLTGSKGGFTRTKILTSVKKQPKNTNQLAKDLHLDYKTIQHHIRVLEENSLITSVRKGSYGTMYFLSEELEQNIMLLNEITNQYGKELE